MNSIIQKEDLARERWARNLGINEQQARYIWDRVSEITEEFIDDGVPPIIAYAIISGLLAYMPAVTQSEPIKAIEFLRENWSTLEPLAQWEFDKRRREAANGDH